MSSCSGCSTTCSIDEKPAFAAPVGLSEAAEALGGLLADSAEFQALSRWSRAVRLDPQVSALVAALQEQRYRYDAEMDETEASTLEEQLEALPVVLEFRGAETRARALFAAVDQAISQMTGLPFAQLAKPSGHG